jgi:hypothetical protein
MIDFCQRTVGEDSLPGYGSVTLVKRPVRIRTQGVVGAGGKNPPATRLAVLSQISRAKRIACPTSPIFAGVRDVINDPILPFETVCKWSQLTAQSRGMPSTFERNTSDGILRIVLIIGATVISPRYSNTESRDRIRTGLFLSGFTNLYQRISPCFIRHPKLVLFPKQKILQQ